MTHRRTVALRARRASQRLRASFAALLLASLATLRLRSAIASETSPVALRVVDATEDRAYIEPGANAGLRAGDEVTLGDGSFQIVSVSDSSAAVATKSHTLSVGTTGRAEVPVNREEETNVRRLPSPQPLATFRGEWRPATVPASTQHPNPVPLTPRERHDNRLVMSDAFYGLLPTNGDRKTFANELRARWHYSSPGAIVWGLDADVALQTLAGDDLSLRPGAIAPLLLRVRELAWSYGAAGNFRSLFGRLRAASAFVGQLDGTRVETPLAPGLQLSVFGGTMPHSINGRPSARVARFGGDVTYQDAESPLQPRFVAGGHVSHFDGALDERKAYASFDLLPHNARLGGHAELSFFDANNPWRASTTELTSASIDASLQWDVFHFGGSVDYRRPERSRWLASLLPAEWLCWSDPAQAVSDCQPGQHVLSWLVDLGARSGGFSVDLGAQNTRTSGADASNFGGFANLRWLSGATHFEAGTTAYQGSVVRSVALTLAPGRTFLHGNADLSLRYRPAVVRYRADVATRIEHSVGGALWLTPITDFELDLQTDWIRGPDVQVLVAQAVATWRLEH